ncbi:MAG: hypothetical protein Q7S03_01075 [bacterium]|nr:hypothetical protein [bacterium]
MNNESNKATNKKFYDWLNKEGLSQWMKQKGVVALTDIDKIRQKLIGKYGNKIVPGAGNHLAEDESYARIFLEILTNILQKRTPVIKKIDDEEFDLRRTDYKFRKSVKSMKNYFIYTLAILLFLALIKYLFF